MFAYRVDSRCGHSETLRRRLLYVIYERAAAAAVVVYRAAAVADTTTCFQWPSSCRDERI